MGNTKLRVESENHFGALTFQCNICGSSCFTQVENLQRETSSCEGCGSTVRMRGIVQALSVALFGESLPIEDFPYRKDIKGIGMSDWDPYAQRLEKKLSYTNTFYHKEPKLDVTNISEENIASLDFIISTDVYEHVCPPVQVAFDNTYKMLKPGGVFVFSVPYSLEESTIEHFPELHEWMLEKREKWTLLNKTKDGQLQEFSDLVFHGGEGETLEMRVFSEKNLIQHLRDAGFSSIEIMKEPCFMHGVYWSCGWSLPILARK